MPTSSRATPTGRPIRGRGPDLCLGRRLDLCAEPALFRRHGQDAGAGVTDIIGARVLASVRRQDHHRPHLAGRFDQGASPGRCLSAGAWRRRADFNQYGTRRGNHEVMMRGTFANIRIRNHMLGPNGIEGGYTIHYPSRKRCRSTTRRCSTRPKACRSSSSPASRIRQRLVARLGGQGHQPARRPRRDRPELRAHPPLEPGRHGRA
jgi:aconitate hydratase